MTTFSLVVFNLGTQEDDIEAKYVSRTILLVARKTII